MWRARGLALDRCLPDVLAVPTLSPDLMRQRIPSRVQVPGQKDSIKLTDEEVYFQEAGIFEETQKCKTVGRRKNGESQDGLE